MRDTVLEGWLKHRKSQQSCGNILDQFRGYAGCDGFGGLLELEDPRGTVLRWRDELNLAPKSLNVYMSLVKSFYRHYDVDVGFLPQVRNRVIYPHKVLTLDEIGRMVDYADIRMKALILFLYNSGARVGSALGLNYGRINWREDPPLKVHFYPSETKFEVEYDTFIGSDCVEAFKRYFKWRNRRGESLRAESPLFMTKYRGRLSYGGSRSAMKVIIGKAGIEIDKNERLTHHSFRGAFQHNLQAAGVNQYVIEKLIGHFTENRTTGRYSLGLTEKDLREAYKQASWSLEVDEAKVQELESKVSETERALGVQIVSNQKREELMVKRMDAMENQIKLMSEYIKKKE